jgi:hypothetical protein
MEAADVTVRNRGNGDANSESGLRRLLATDDVILDEESSMLCLRQQSERKSQSARAVTEEQSHTGSSETHQVHYSVI